MNTGQPPEDVCAIDQVIDDLENSGWMQGDQMPAAENWANALAARGYVLHRTPIDGDTLFGVPEWNDPYQLLNLFVAWLHRKRQLAGPQVTHDLAGDLEDLVLHFVAERRETALIPDQPA